jgi:2-amino-4-deoxychorismate synthase
VKNEEPTGATSAPTAQGRREHLPLPGSGAEIVGRLRSGRSFALLHRPHVAPDLVEVLIGDVTTVASLADIPAPEGQPVLAVVPFAQIRERGFDVVDDGTPLLVLAATERFAVPLDALRSALPDGPRTFRETGFDVPDDEYRRQVSAVLTDEIAEGAGSNFVLHRCLTGRVDEPPVVAALGAFRRLLRNESSAYWRFVVHTPETTLVGASPERHVSVTAGVATMNPISGTLRFPPDGYPSAQAYRSAVLAFLADPKERDELAMVVDEELKMMAVVGDRGGRVRGPYLKRMSHLAHTEYVIEGQTSFDVRDVLRHTLFAPTVTGSPIRNACRVIARHEQRGRRYYAGLLALVTSSADGEELDAPILIRTAEIAPDGTVRIAAGATLVRGSTPEAELAETRAKAAGILSAFTGAAPARGRVALPADPPEVARELSDRNRTLASFWLTERPEVAPAGRRADVLVVDAEDDFTGMLAHQLDSLGLTTTVRSWDDVGSELASSQLLVLGPGPGDPRDLGDPRIAALHGFAKRRLAMRGPLLGICLGHQVLAQQAGLVVRRLERPHQGLQEEVDLFGRRTRVGFYNSFVALPQVAVPRDLALSVAGDRVIGLRGNGFAGLQFHPESVLTTDGIGVLRAELSRLVGAADMLRR